MRATALGRRSGNAGAPSGVTSPSLPLEEKYNAPMVKR